MTTYVICFAPKWGKCGTSAGRISKVSQHHQVAYQITRIVTLNQKINTQNVFCFTCYYFCMMKHVPCYTLNWGKYGTNRAGEWGGGVNFKCVATSSCIISNYSSCYTESHKKDRMQFTLLAITFT